MAFLDEIACYQEPQVALVEAIIIVVSIGLSLLAAHMMKKDLNKDQASTQFDDNPTTLAKRGSYIPWIVGRRRVGYVFGFAGERRLTWEFVDTEGGMAGGGADKPDPPTQDVYYETGWHLVAVGPCDLLHNIYQNGKVIFSGPISRATHPSGTSIDLGFEGIFEIYWGESSQPAKNINGIISKWPHACYIYWNQKRLGTAANWSVIEYDIERHPSNTILSQSNAVMTTSWNLSGDKRDIIDNLDGASGVGYFQFDGSLDYVFKLGFLVRLEDNAMSDTDLTVSDIEVEEVLAGVFGNQKVYTTLTKVFFEEALSGTDDAGTLETYEPSTARGINPAHAIAELLFEDYPNGLALSQDDWNIDSLETVGTITGPINEALISSWFGPDGRDARTVLGAGIQDLGVMIPINSNTGLLTFTLIRDPSGTLNNIKRSMLVDPLPQVTALHGEKPADKLIFSFPDWKLRFKNRTIAVDEDGQALLLEHSKARKLPITISVDYSSAATIAERRSQEELAGNALYKIKANHAARTIQPGEAIIVENITDTLRVVSVKYDPNTNVTELQCLDDAYGIPISSFINVTGGGEVTIPPTEPDLAVGFFELPEYYKSREDEMVVSIPRIRAHNQISGANIFMSLNGDDPSPVYDYILTQLRYHTGGTLLDALPSTDPARIDQGPTFTALGPDILDVESLTDANWRLGKQVVIINRELFLLKQITAIGGNVYRLDGLLRARGSTPRQDHSIGDTIYISRIENLRLTKDPILGADIDLWIKAQATSGAGTIPIGSTPKLHINNTEGRGIVPMRATNLRPTLPYPNVNAYKTGNDMTFKWSYFSNINNRTGAGMQGYGSPSGSSPADDEFLVTFSTIGDTIKRQFSTTAVEYVYPNATLQNDFASEPSSFKVKVEQTRGGYKSEVTEIIITKET